MALCFAFIMTEQFINSVADSVGNMIDMIDSF